MMSTTFYCFNPLNHPNQNHEDPFHHQNQFFGNLLVSQLETVEALKVLDNQVIIIILSKFPCVWIKSSRHKEISIKFSKQNFTNFNSLFLYFFKLGPKNRL